MAITKVFYDTEFTGLHQATTLISIGCITDNECEFYAEFVDYDKEQVDDWLTENVIKHLSQPQNSQVKPGVNPAHIERYGDMIFIASTLKAWLETLGEVQMISDCLSYDWVLFCQLWGHAFKIPPNVSPAPRDINQDIADYLGISEKAAFEVNREEFCGLISNAKKHHSGWDARIIKACYEKINQ